MALGPSNSSNLERLALKGLKIINICINHLAFLRDVYRFRQTRRCC